MRGALALTALAALALAVPADGESGTRPATIVSFQHPVYAVALDGGRLGSAVGPCGAVTIRDLRSGRQYGFGVHCTPGDGIPGGFGALALGGTRAVWWTWWHGLSYHQDLSAGRWGGRVDDAAANPYPVETSSDCEEALLPTLAADGDVAVYSLVDLEGPADDPCGVPVTKGGGVYSVDAKGPLPHVPPAVALAVSERLLAVVPLDPSAGRRTIVAAANGPVDVYDLRTKRLVAAARPDGRAVSVALSQQLLAVLVRSAGGVRIEWFDPRRGTALGARPVPTAAAERLAVTGTTIVYRVGRRILTLDTKSGSGAVLATAPATPPAVSADGGRVVWGENAGGRGRIVGVTLPPR